MPNNVEDLEIQLLIEAVYQHTGYDFRNYAPASLRRRILAALQKEKLPTISSLQDKVLHDRECFQRFLDTITVNVTAMFRDPHFHVAFREKIVPLLRGQPFFRVWCAGCSTGEEAYSLAILLEEEGLYDRCRIYATELNEGALQKAKDGVFPLAVMAEYTSNYQKAGGKRDFSDYYTAAYDHAIIAGTLKRNLVFAQHNLVTDASFNEFHAILCRNVMIYFNTTLQARVHNLLYDSLAQWGALCLGDKESLRFSPHEKDYEAVVEGEKIYRRIK
ncbi:MAG: protein-glutamate O-methyltransferase CheR [Armatimonadetes bacterium]|nr:protein-glutamate O-methyltransferase CheR [Armatimonadota bacterium]